ncbi:methyltransferase domain-containing protein [Nocardioides KLBMP 9356]|uniref:Methyltransferase domain-containing protein n=1 Tax=Nocardioides potassii TaxID=2911371 RepID=A0ABS9HAY1_9ACTN|nr:methyltransferase domain-containing protein [Nocardioides potassii]MCF6377649.1 methyltransferase domain-containing protein [Nocardioides potassii]
MGIGYATAYRAGIIPWEKAGRRDQPALERLLGREERDRPDQVRRALDLGCGRGAHTRLLVERGWDAMGIDNVRQAVDVAVRRNGLDDARFVIGDVRHLVHSGVGTAFDLFLDVGCFQGLDAAGRTRMAGGVTTLAAPGATILLSTSPRRWPGARQVEAEHLEQSFEGWRVSQPYDPESADEGWGSWFRLVRA